MYEAFMQVAPHFRQVLAKRGLVTRRKNGENIS
jgi:hypothetical protein